jgi:hypothetical protein
MIEVLFKERRIVLRKESKEQSNDVPPLLKIKTTRMEKRTWKE